MNTNIHLTTAEVPTARRSAAGRVAGTAVGLGLTLGLLAGPVSAADRPVASEPPTTAEMAQAEPVAVQAAPVPVDTRPVEARPVEARPVDSRPEDPREVEVLHLSCGTADGAVDGGRTLVGCQWRAATNRDVIGYELWRIVDRGERQLVGRFGLDTQGARDAVPADAFEVRYVVLAVNENGRVVGRSRVESITLTDSRGGEIDAVPARVRIAWPRSVR